MLERITEDEELIKALRYCADGDNDCGDACPFYDKQPSCSMYDMMNDAADALEAAEQRIAELEEDKEFLQFLVKSYHSLLDEETKKNIDGHLHYDCRKGEKSDV